MFAAIPQTVTDAAAWIGAVTVIAGGCTAIVTRRPFRWLWRTLVSDPLSRWFRHQVAESETGKLVKYHLGPNGTTPAVHLRLSRLEIAALLDREMAAFDDMETDDDV